MRQFLISYRTRPCRSSVCGMVRTGLGRRVAVAVVCQIHAHEGSPIGAAARGRFCGTGVHFFVPDCWRDAGADVSRVAGQASLIREIVEHRPPVTLSFGAR